MQLQGRELSIETQGADVSLLHFELRLLGREIPEEELIENFFGEEMRQAVERLQKELDLDTTGVVDEVTARHINAEMRVAALYFDKRYILDPVGASWASIEGDQDMRRLGARVTRPERTDAYVLPCR